MSQPSAGGSGGRTLNPSDLPHSNFEKGRKPHRVGVEFKGSLFGEVCRKPVWPIKVDPVAEEAVLGEPKALNVEHQL